MRKFFSFLCFAQQLVAEPEGVLNRYKNGILSGSCEIKSDTEIQWKYYIGLFESEEELRNELGKYFKNILIVRPTSKMSLYFMASNGRLPFYNR